MSVKEESAITIVMPKTAKPDSDKEDDKKQDTDTYMSLQVNQTPFIQKLYSMLEDNNLSEFIHWSPTEDSFFINAGEKFSQILCLYFRHTNIASFVRQLSMYGFHKVSQHSRESTRNRVGITDETAKILSNFNWEFKHIDNAFKRNDFESLRGIKRRVGNRSRKKFQRHIVITSDTPGNNKLDSVSQDSSSVHIYENTKSEGDNHQPGHHSHTYHYITMNDGKNGRNQELPGISPQGLPYFSDPYNQPQHAMHMPYMHNYPQMITHQAQSQGQGQGHPQQHRDNNNAYPYTPHHVPTCEDQNYRNNANYSSQELLGSILAKQNQFQDEIKEVNGYLQRLGQDAAEIGLMVQLLSENQSNDSPQPQMLPHGISRSTTNDSTSTSSGPGNSLSTGQQLTAYTPHSYIMRTPFDKRSDSSSDRTGLETTPESTEDNSSSGSGSEKYSSSADANKSSAAKRMNEATALPSIVNMADRTNSPSTLAPIKDPKSLEAKTKALSTGVNLQSLLN